MKANEPTDTVVRVYAKPLKWPLAEGTPEQIQAYEKLKVLHYSYSVNGPLIGFRFHLLCEVGEPWQAAAKAKLAALLQANPAYELQTVELGAAPWYVEALVKKTALHGARATRS